ncbi:MAG: hypothetical protein Q7S04_01860 [Candidatus Moranbacteria bacterium]|nr:hypothetical protein [Candidatus Moranbacteria bacterium]
MKEGKYFFELKITKEQSALVLKCSEEILGKKEWQEGRDMGRRLFEGIAELLKESNLKPIDVSDFVVETDMPEGYTSMRIAETVKKVYAFGVAFPR